MHCLDSGVWGLEFEGPENFIRNVDFGGFVHQANQIVVNGFNINGLGLLPRLSNKYWKLEKYSCIVLSPPLQEGY